MYPLKTPTFFKSYSRPPSPPSRPNSAAEFDRKRSSSPSRPVNRLSLTGFRRSSTNASIITSAPPSPTLAPLVHDGSYLELLSLRFSEAVSKALGQPSSPQLAGCDPVIAGKRPIPAGRGHALGAVFASELGASRDKPHLYRAVIRCLHRPLTVLLTNLSNLLVPLMSFPEFHRLPAGPHLTLTPPQTHALALATFASELLQTFDELELGLSSKKDALGGDPARVGGGDGLKPFREGLLSIITRVLNPLVTAIRNEVLPIIEALENPPPPTPPPPPPTARHHHHHHHHHPSIVTLQSTIPVYARAISRYTDASPSAAQPLLATFLLNLVWCALVALSHRPLQTLPPPLHHHYHRVTPQPSSATAWFGTKRGTGSPSPPSTHLNDHDHHHLMAAAGEDATALLDILKLFPRPNEVTNPAAREAVDEAVEALGGLATLLKNPGLVVQGDGEEKERLLERLTADIPTLISLAVLLQVVESGFRGGEDEEDEEKDAIRFEQRRKRGCVPSMLSLSTADYRRTCLTGFSRAEECAGMVGQRVLDLLPPASVVARWLEGELGVE